jgi:hypothetical protein
LGVGLTVPHRKKLSLLRNVKKGRGLGRILLEAELLQEQIIKNNMDVFL